MIEELSSIWTSHGWNQQSINEVATRLHGYHLQNNPQRQTIKCKRIILTSVQEKKIQNISDRVWSINQY